MKKMLIVGLIALMAVGTSWATGDGLTSPLNTRELGSSSDSDSGRVDARGAAEEGARDSAEADVAGRSISDRRGRMVRMGNSSVVPEELGWKSRWKKKQQSNEDDEGGDDDEDEDGDVTPGGP